MSLPDRLVEFAGDGTRGLFINLLEPLVAAAAKRAVRRDLANLKEVLEAGAVRCS